MSVQKPQPVNFKALTEKMQKQAESLEKIITILQNDIKEVGALKNPTSDDLKLLEIYKNDLEHFTQEYEVKKTAYQVYLRRVHEEQEKEQADLKDFLENHKKTYEKATILKHDKRLPDNLRNHLKEILNYNIIFELKVPLKNRIQYYLELKKEVELCLNYKKQ